jgi:hypothetical protein
MKKKTLSLAKLLDKAAVLTQKLVRLKGADEWGMCVCVTCGCRRHWKEMQGGHYISRKYTGTKIDQRNIWPQCGGCNGPGRGRPDEFARWMVNYFGPEILEELAYRKRMTMKYKRHELEDIIVDLRAEVKAKEEELGC